MLHETKVDVAMVTAIAIGNTAGRECASRIDRDRKRERATRTNYDRVRNK